MNSADVSPGSPTPPAPPGPAPVQPAGPGEAHFVGPYRLVGSLGEGGMGVVHLALDPRGRAVAVKVLRPHVAADQVARRRLMREVEVLRRVRHPNVAEVLDADLDAATPYLVTAFVPARTLDEQVREHGPLPVPYVAHLARVMAGALRAIHAAGIVHRDVKPANVLLLDDAPILIDFGIAHLVDESRITMTGLVMGTPGYLPPELVEGQAISPATDWWGWGATLAFAATGRPPFGSGPASIVLDRVQHGKADLDGVDPRLTGVLSSALTVNPVWRGTADMLLAGLDDIEPWRPPARPMAPAMTPPVVPPAAVQAGQAGQAAQADQHPVRPVPAAAPASRPKPLSQDEIGTAVVAPPPPPGRRPSPDEIGTAVVAPPSQPSAAPQQVAPPAPVADAVDLRAAARTSVVSAPRNPTLPMPTALQDTGTARDTTADAPIARQAAPAPFRSAAPVRPAPYPVANGSGAAAAAVAGPGGGVQVAPGARQADPRQAGPHQVDPRRGPDDRSGGPPGPRPGGGPVEAAPSAVAMTLLLVLVLLATLMTIVPGLVIVGSAVWLLLARVIERTMTGTMRRRMEFGPRSGDVAVGLAALPWRLLSSVPKALGSAILPAILGTSAAFFAAGVADPLNPDPTGRIALAVGCVFAWGAAWWGPGGGVLRRGTRGATRKLVARRKAWYTTLFALAFVIAGSLMMAAGDPAPDWQPIGVNGLPGLGFVEYVQSRWDALTGWFTGLFSDLPSGF